MKLLYKIYKSRHITLGDEKKIQFKSEDIIKTHYDDPLDSEETIENIANIKETALEESKQMLEEAGKQKKNILEDAKQEAVLIIDQAYEDSKTILENAKNKGYNEGLRLGEQKGYKNYQDRIEEASQIKKETLAKRKIMVKELEKEIIDLVIYTMEKVIDHEIDNNHELLLNLIKNGLEKCTFTETLIIRVNENDYKIVNSNKNNIYMMTEGVDEVQIKSDAALAKGSVVIETLSGKVDASIDSQINQIEALFKKLLKGEGFHEDNRLNKI